jgi:UDP-N-acetylmuramate--alanine ligase
VRRAFLSFLENIPFYGFAALCIDHPEVQALIPALPDRRIVTYGHSPQADVRALRIRPGPSRWTFDAVISGPAAGRVRTLADITLPMVGRHNVQNALAAIAIANEMGIKESVLRRALEQFGGVKRRFTRVGEAGGIAVIDDYGHHPVEIAAVLAAARTSTEGRVIAVVQPHRYSRLNNLFEEFCTAFNDADSVIVADVYAAGEAPIEGVNRDALVEGLRAHGHRQVVPLAGPESLADTVAGIAGPGDMVVCLGAGSITGWAAALPGELAKRQDGGKRANGGTA